MVAPTDVLRIAGQIVQTYYCPPPIPTRDYDWSAIPENYDGAEDSRTRYLIGWGRTREEAIADLREKLEGQDQPARVSGGVR